MSNCHASSKYDGDIRIKLDRRHAKLKFHSRPSFSKSRLKAEINHLGNFKHRKWGGGEGGISTDDAKVFERKGLCSSTETWQPFHFRPSQITLPETKVPKQAHFSYDTKMGKILSHFNLEPILMIGSFSPPPPLMTRVIQTSDATYRVKVPPGR